MSQRPLLVFDYDGTLVDSSPCFSQSIADFSIMKGLPYDVNKMQVGYVDPSKNDLGWGIPLEQQPELFEEMANWQDEMSRTKGLYIPMAFEGVMDVFLQLANHYDMAVVTARLRDSFYLSAKKNGMYEYLQAYRTLCCTRERGQEVKPAPDALLCLIKETGHTPDQVVMIGDTTSDILMAHAAKVKSVAVTYGLHTKERLTPTNPTVFIDRFDELPIALHSLRDQ